MHKRLSNERSNVRSNIRLSNVRLLHKRLSKYKIIIIEDYWMKGQMQDQI